MVVDGAGRFLWLWRAWTARRERIADCGFVWAVNRADAEQLARFTLAGPYMSRVTEIQLEQVRS